MVDGIESKITIFNPIVRTYEINSVCDLGTTHEEIMTRRIFPTIFQLSSGMYNDDEDLVEYVNTLEVNGRTITTDELFPIREPLHENHTNGLGRNYNSTYFDVMLMAPFILIVMDASPEVIEILSMNQHDTNESYIMRVQTEISKCQ